MVFLRSWCFTCNSCRNTQEITGAIGILRYHWHHARYHHRNQPVWKRTCREPDETPRSPKPRKRCASGCRRLTMAASSKLISFWLLCIHLVSTMKLNFSFSFEMNFSIRSISSFHHESPTDSILCPVNSCSSEIVGEQTLLKLRKSSN